MVQYPQLRRHGADRKEVDSVEGRYSSTLAQRHECGLGLRCERLEMWTLRAKASLNGEGQNVKAPVQDHHEGSIGDVPAVRAA